MALKGIAGKARAYPLIHHGTVDFLAVRALGAGSDEISIVHGSHGVTVTTPAAVTGQYVFTLPTQGGCTILSAQATFEGASAKSCKIETVSNTAGTVTVTVQDDALADVTLAAAEYINLLVAVDSL